MQKLPTINQINGRLLNKPAISEYLFNGTDKERYNQKNYKNRYFNFVFLNNHNEPRQCELTINGNFIFGAANREFEEVIKSKNEYSNKCKREEVFYLVDLYFKVETVIEFTGVYMYIKTDFRAIGTPEPYYKTISKKIKVSSNKTFEDFNQLEYLQKYVDRFTYAEGIFRSIQLNFNLTKKEVPAKYKELLHESKNSKKYEVDTNRALIKRLSKKLNIIVDQYEIIQNYKLLQLLKTEPRQRNKVKAVKAPSMFDLLEDASWQHDTEDGILGYAEEVLDNYKGMILI